MNSRCYRVVFNESLGVWVAVAETVMARGKRSHGRVKRVAAVAGIVGILGGCAVAAQGAALPIASTLANRTATNQGVSSVLTSGNTMTVNQNAAVAIKNWDEFNVGSGYTVNFVQPDSSSRILNRIWDASPSVISGTITANGQVYLINRNGITFAAGSVVNVGGLVASALNISTEVFKNGYLNLTSTSAGATPAFYYAGTVSKNADGSYAVTDFDSDASASAGNAVVKSTGNYATVRNEGSLTATSGGSILLFAPIVQNAGKISTTSGQVVLAAGAKVYLTESASTSLRGVYVEIDPFTNGASDSSTVTNTGLADALNGIFAYRGNITLAAMAVNNNGLLEATTGKTENGSIYLQGRYGVTTALNSSATYTTFSTKGGTVELGTSSQIEIPVESITEAQVVAEAQAEFVPDASETAAVQASRFAALEALIRKEYTVTSADSFKSSKIMVDGAEVVLRTGSEIVAPGANVVIKAAATRDKSQMETLGALNYDDLTQSQYFQVSSGTGRIAMESGASIDVSGYENVAVDGIRNQVSATLTSNELADAPVQRNGVLYKSTVSYSLLDNPTGVLSAANLSGAVANIAYSLQEKAATGGAVSFLTSGDAIIDSGAKVDVSGGSVKYSDATLTVTQLIKGNKIYDISKASGDVAWDRITTRNKFVAGYTEGKNAGSITIAAKGGNSVVQGTFLGSTTAGVYQQTLSTTPTGGTLSIDVGGSVRIGAASGLSNAEAFWADPFNATIQTAGYTGLSTSMLSSGGFSSISVAGGNTQSSSLTVEGGYALNLDAGTNLNLSAANIYILGNIHGAGMDLSATAIYALVLGDGVSIDASGLWINDYLAKSRGASLYQGIKPIDGGSVSLGVVNSDDLGLNTSVGLTLGTGSTINVNGGAMISGTGTLSLGDAGAISLTGLKAYSGSNLLGYALASGNLAGSGGSLTITAPGLRINDTTSASDELALSTDDVFGFTTNGFSALKFVASYGNASIGAGTTLDLQRQVRRLSAKVKTTQATGATLAGLGSLTTLASYVEDPIDFTLSATYQDASVSKKSFDFGVLEVGSGALINVGVGGSITLQAGRQLTMDGTLKAAAGTVTLDMVAPLAAVDPGDLNDQSIFVGADADIDVAGTALVGIDRYGRATGEVLGGGTVSLDAEKGYVVVKKGAKIALNGSAATLYNTTTSVWQTLCSDAGALSLSAADGILFDASVSAFGGGSTAAGGTFRLSLTVDSSPAVSGTRVLEVGDDLYADGSTAAAALGEAVAGGNIASLSAAQAWIDSSALSNAGFDNVTLTSTDTIRFAATTHLSATRQLQLFSELLDVADADVHLYGNYVELGSINKVESKVGLNEADLVSGTGRFQVDADQLDLLGGVSISGATQTTLKSAGDMRLIGLATTDSSGNSTKKNEGSLSVLGSLTLAAAQIYPTTLTTFTIGVGEVDGAGGSAVLTIKGSGSVPDAPYSAAGTLIMEADTINQGGVLRAPFGTIELRANDTLTLQAGSLTSASGEGLEIPYGTLDDGVWYDPKGNKLTTVPQPTVILSGASVTQDVGSTINVSGGGDLYASEFVSGSGGSTDILTKSNTYAIIPSYDSKYAPYDASFDLVAGTQITLTAASGLPAGTYTLLPASYALLSGAYKITLISGYTGASTGTSVSTALGGTIAVGSLSVAGTSISSSQTVGVLVESGTVTRKHSEYDEALASTYLDALAASGTTVSHYVDDGGHLIVAATNDISLQGNIYMAAAESTADAKRRGSLLDISLLASTLDSSGKPTGDIVVGNSSGGDRSGVITLHVNADQIAAIGADSVLIGGERTQTESGMSVAVTANQLRYAADGIGKGSSAPSEIILAATDTVTVESGASLQASSNKPTQAAALQSTVAGDGALLRVAGDNVVVTRTGGTGSQGTLMVGDGAALTGYSVQADGSKDAQLAGGASVEATAFTLGSKYITVGGDGGSSTLDGTNLDQVLLRSIAASATSITLRGYEGIGFADSLSLGGDGTPLESLGLDAPTLAWLGSTAGTVSINALNVSLTNTTGTTAATASSGDGSLVLAASGATSGSGILDINDGSMGMTGFGSVSMNATGGIQIAGSGTTRVGGSLTLAAPIITGGSGADRTLDANGVLTTMAVSSANTLAAQSGASLVLEGSQIDHGSQIRINSGTVKLIAENGDVNLLNGSGIDVSSEQTDFGGTTVSEKAGAIYLTATLGSVHLNPGATLDMSGLGNASAGSLTISAPTGEADLAGTLKAGITAAGEAADASSGSFSLDVGSLASLDELNELTNEFRLARSVRLRKGDLLLSQGHTMKAKTIELDADAGNVEIDGTLDATGDSGGTISISARRVEDVGGGITINGTLDASATSDSGDGGTVTLSVSQDTASQANPAIVFGSGSQIDVHGGSSGSSGQLILYAPRVTDLGNYTLVGGVATTTESGKLVFDGAETQTVSSIVAGYVAATAGDIASSSTAIGKITYTVTDSSIGTLTDGTTVLFVTTTAASSTQSPYLTVNGKTYAIMVLSGSTYTKLSGGTTAAYASYKVVYKSQCSGTTPCWVLQSSETPSGSATSAVSVVALTSSVSAVDGSVIMFVPQAASFGGQASNKTGNVVITATGLSSYATLVGTSGNAIGVGNLVAGTSYAAVYNKASNTYTLLDTPSGVIHLSTSVNSSSLTIDTAISFIATADIASTGSNPLLIINDDASATLVDSQGKTLSAGYFQTGVTYKISKISSSVYAVRPLDGDYSTKANEVITVTTDASSTSSVAFTLNSLSETSGSVAYVMLNVNGTEAILENADGSNAMLADLTLGKNYLAVKQSDGSYRLVSMENSVPIADNGLKLSGASDVTINAVKSYSASNLDAKLQNEIAADSRQFYSTWSSSILDSLLFVKSNAVLFQPSVEIVSNGNMTVGDSWNFNTDTWRYGSGASSVGGALSLRATGTLTIQSALSDGFVSEFEPSTFENGWSYNLVAGADLTAASSKATQGDSGNIVVAGIVRTGTGSITLSAANDIDLSATGSSVYSAGRRVTPDTITNDMAGLKTDQSLYLTEDGGNISLSAGSNIIGRASGSSPTVWEWRTGTSGATATRAAAWGVRFDLFDEEVGALGGGDVTISAGGNISNLYVALPTQGEFTFTGTTVSGYSMLNSGNLKVSAAGDILGGSYLVENGSADISAADSITMGSNGKAIQLYLADSQLTVSAGGNIDIGMVGNVSMLAVSPLNSSTNFEWFSYSADSSLDVRSVAGNVNFVSTSASNYLPAVLEVVASGGSIDYGMGGYLYPSSVGQLALYAEGDISGSAALTMVDIDPAQLPDATTSLSYTIAAKDPALVLFDTSYTDNGLLTNGVRSNASTESGSLHDGDTTPAQIISNSGDISGTYTIAKAVEISAGNDIKNLTLTVENLTSSDVSSISAGRDIIYDTLSDAKLWHSKISTSSGYTDNTSADTNPGIKIYGPGLLMVTAGRNIELANSGGIVSEGPGINSYLGDVGASIVVEAGTPPGINATSFASTYLSGDAASAFLALSTAEQITEAEEILRKQFITTYLLSGEYLSEWQAYAAQYGVTQSDPAMTDPTKASTQLLDRFRYKILWSELQASGEEATAILADDKANPTHYTSDQLTAAALYARGFKALNLAGVGDVFTYNNGNVSLRKSQIRTKFGGDIEVLVPSGSLNIGSITSVNPNVIDASRMGLVSNGGNTYVYVLDSVNVNTSRWFAIDGGDILGWASTGDIDAGKGSRTALVSSSQRLSINYDTGEITLVDAGGSSGSGIATLFNKPITTGGNIYLYSPRGVVDAGEAGIRSAGNVSLSANVIGADFITAVGTGSPASAPAAATVSFTSSSNDSATKGSTEATALGKDDDQKTANSVLTVEVTADSATNALPATAAGNDQGDDESTKRRKKTQREGAGNE
jgi:filamentous hemagglutinin family protein